MADRLCEIPRKKVSRKNVPRDKSLIMADWASLPDIPRWKKAILMVDWASLPDGVIVLIARLSEDMSDFVAFRGTCTAWRAATTLKDFVKWDQQLPLLMLNEQQVYEKLTKRKRIPMKYMRGDCEFFSLYMDKKIRISLPQAKGKRCFASKGWLITFGSSRDMSLLNPITRVEIHLPRVCKGDYWVWRAVLSASPSETSEYIVVILYLTSHKNYIGFWKSGELAWRKTQQQIFQDVSYHKGKIYAKSISQIWMFDVDVVWDSSCSSEKTINATKIMELPHFLISTSAFFVECGGKLLIFTCSYAFIPNPLTPVLSKFNLIDFDVINNTHTCISSLDNEAIFIGINEAFCVDARRFPEIIEPNHVYLSDGNYYSIEYRERSRWDWTHNINDDSLLMSITNAWVTPTF